MIVLALRKYKFPLTFLLSPKGNEGVESSPPRERK